MSLHVLSGGNSLSTLGKALADPLEGVQINQDEGQGVLICTNIFGLGFRYTSLDCCLVIAYNQTDIHFLVGL